MDAKHFELPSLRHPRRSTPRPPRRIVTYTILAGGAL